MTFGQSTIVMLVVSMLAGGQVLFKLAALRLAEPGGLALSNVLSPLMLTAFVVYGLATALWVWVLRSVPLNIAYPFVALAFVIVPLLSHWLLGESLKINMVVGGAIIMFGVWVSVGLDL